MPAPAPTPIPVVRYAFECADLPWYVRHVHLQEFLGRPYDCVLHLVLDDPDAPLDDLVGANAFLEISRSEDPETLPRVVKGCVQEVEVLACSHHRTHTRIHLAPALSYLYQTRRSRIFQELTIPEILDQVLTPVLSARDRAFDLSALDKRGFQPRDYCVQYEETDLDFLHRLLEEEGLAYHFDQTSEKWERLVLMAEGEDYPDFEGLDGRAEVPVIPDRGETAELESIEALEWSRRTRAPRVTQRAWDWISNPPEIHEETYTNEAQEEHPPQQPPPLGELYDHDDHRLLDLELKARAQRKQEALATRDGMARGQGNLTGFSPGLIFELVDHEREGRYLLTHVTHSGDAPEGDLLEGNTRGPSYENRFLCIPASRPYRLDRISRKPIIPGPQTAVVTGPEPEEIHTDEHGRIKVRMHWDRSDTPPEDASCWIRVAQTWAGPGWGTLFIPRVGMEVLVTFINGDPDRPLVTGCVYNGGNQPPYPLPDEKTKSTIKTRSSPGGDGYNELRFEDAAGNEEIFLHAQKNLNEVVGNANSRSVGAAQTISVGGSRTVTVQGNHSVIVKGKGKGSKDQALDPPHYSVTVDSAYELTASKTIQVNADDRITLQCKTTRIELTPTKIVLQAGEEGSRIELDIEALILSKKKGWVLLDKEGNVTAKAKDEAALTLTSCAELVSKAGATVALTGEAAMGAPGAAEGKGASLLLNANAALQGHEVGLTSQGAGLTLTTAAELVSKENTLIQGATTACIGDAVIVQGNNVDVLGSTLANIRAPLVTIN